MKVTVCKDTWIEVIDNIGEISDCGETRPFCVAESRTDFFEDWFNVNRIDVDITSYLSELVQVTDELVEWTFYIRGQGYKMTNHQLGKGSMLTKLKKVMDFIKMVNDVQYKGLK